MKTITEFEHLSREKLRQIQKDAAMMLGPMGNDIKCILIFYIGSNGKVKGVARRW